MALRVSHGLTFFLSGSVGELLLIFTLGTTLLVLWLLFLMLTIHLVRWLRSRTITMSAPEIELSASTSLVLHGNTERRWLV